MSLVQFRYRKSIPTNPVKGSFYWVDLDDKIQIWFSPDGIAENLILLSNEVDSSIIERIETTEGKIDALQERIDELDLELSDSDYDVIVDRVNQDLNIVERIEETEGSIRDLQEKIDEINLEISDSDYDFIINKVSEKINPTLNWIEIQ